MPAFASERRHSTQEQPMAETFIDIYGVPEFFVSRVSIEDAGDGMIRLINCIARSGCIQPVCTMVMPAQAVLQLCRNADGLAMSVLMSGGISRENETARTPLGLN
jgi:hypothetical protein